MTRYAAFLRGVNLGKRTVKSAELKAAFESMGLTDVKTLLASGNVLFNTTNGAGLKLRIEAGLKARFGFEIGTVLRSLDELKQLVASDPFGRAEAEDAKLHVMLFDAPLPSEIHAKGIDGDYAIPRLGEREVFIIAYRKPDGTYLAGSQLALEKTLPKGTLVTSRNWNTIIKATA